MDKAKLEKNAEWRAPPQNHDNKQIRESKGVAGGNKGKK